MAKKINVYIITGFLGSGKTTILNSLLKQFDSEKNVVIENEFGKINVDASLINGAFESVYELTNGCICCSINNQLIDALSQIDQLKNKPNNLFIETTGIADAGEVAAVFSQLYVMDKFDLKKILCVVDAENIEQYIDSNIEIIKQIIVADRILINKADPEDQTKLDRIKNHIKGLNCFAEITSSAHGDLHKNHLLEPNAKDKPISSLAVETKSTHKIKSVLYETELKFNIQMLKYELFKSLFFYYDQIFRIKGYVLDASNEVFLVQSVGKGSTVTPAKNISIEKSQLVVIGKELEVKTIERLLKLAFVKIKKAKNL
jgi:G3E family GTPase